MKKALIVIICLVLLSTVALTNEVSEYESFISESGELVIKDFYAIGKIDRGFEASTEVQALVLTHPQTERVLKGLIINVNTYVNKIGARSETSFLSEEESLSLSSALAYIIETTRKWVSEQKEYTEIVFNVTDDFRVGFYQKGLKQEAFLSCGKISNVTHFLKKVDELTILKEYTDKGISLLAEK